MSGKTIRVGILGPGAIVRRMYSDFYKARGLEITAVASRSMERAREAAAQYGAKYALGSYEELARCPEVDLVYIATPHAFHCDQAVLMMEHGKHVLCEKSMAANDSQARRMIACARRNRVFLMEAMWSRFFPAMEKLRELLGQGIIGRVRHVRADFSFFSPFDPQSRLYAPELAGGALLDVGIYVLSAASMVLGTNIERCQSICQKAENGVDALDVIQLGFAGGATAQLMCGVRASSGQDEVIYGEKGRIEIPDFWHTTRFRVIKNDGARVEFSFPAENEGHHYQFVHARECILNNRLESDVMPLDESLALSRLMTALRREWGVVYPFD